MALDAQTITEGEYQSLRSLFGRALHWRFHDSHHANVRIWRKEWSGDMFEILPFRFIAELTGIGFTLIQHDDSE